MADKFHFKIIIIALPTLGFLGKPRVAVTNCLLKFDEVANFAEQGEIAYIQIYWTTMHSYMFRSYGTLIIFYFYPVDKSPLLQYIFDPPGLYHN